MSEFIQSILTHGSGGTIVQVECHLSNSLPAITIVGLGNKAIDEARERVRSALASSAIPIPRKRITINLAPADMRKETTDFDLAIALAILQAGNILAQPLTTHDAVIGELGLSGTVRAVRGIIGKILAGKALGITRFIVPAGNLEQATLVPDVRIVPVETLAGLYTALQPGGTMVEYAGGGASPPARCGVSAGSPFQSIAGQTAAKRALCIAAAGGHNILLNGPPGTGKSMLARCLPLLLPPLSRHEALEVTHLHSLTSARYDQLITERPFRSPHHSISATALAGGGSPPRPGEITLAHHGILFLDELPEFSRQSIETLRQPLEERTITIARTKDTVEFPASFMLVATANPCPCGYYTTARHCSCPASRIQSYRMKLSGPLMDRIDMHIDVEPVEHHTLLEGPGEVTADASPATAINTARTVQLQRAGVLNSQLDSQAIRRTGMVDPDARSLLDNAATRLSLSARGYMRTIRIARTIADLAHSPSVRTGHISEALRYRPHSPALPQ